MDIICSRVLEHTPVKKGGKPRFPCWVSSDLKQLVINKKIAHKTYKSNPTPTTYNTFNTLRTISKDMSSRCNTEYMAHINSSIPYNMKSFWSFVNKVNTKGSTRSTDSYYIKKVTETSPEGLFNLFAKHFSSVFSTRAPPIYDFDTT